MRQTLFRVVFDDPWAFWKTDPATGLEGVGIAWLIGGVLLIWLAALLIHARFRWQPEFTRLAAFAGGAIGVLTVLGLAGMLPAFSFPIFGYGFMTLVGFLAALGFARRQARRAGLDPETMFDLGFWLLVPGVIGGRMAYLIQYSEQVFAGKQGGEFLFAIINLSNGGLVLIGAILGGAAGFFAYCHRHGVNQLMLADVIMPSIFIGIGFGRLGCLLNGCCFGDACSLPWAMTFPQGSVPFGVLADRGFIDPEAAATMPLHPTQIYSSLNGFVLATVTALYYPRRRHDGDLLALGCILYPMTRFILEFLRNDEMGQLGTRLTISQFYSLGILTAGVALLIYLSLRGREATSHFSAATPTGAGTDST
ncbi:MAG: prolipoprotein diacylglyceryl transferase [Planctomycetota bacterium]|nr:MAG: prolipoprotein diacylglyceryl transferase [Planctomycetota bacterium]REJ97007.1 MAG: prolipoprotein diacylglyceryl transferase [Planctomycetota bacterium]REK20130.1 MAG: prolipoprotein diacylglyceryl transferase [Planctomycetota bacterium]REK34320.1 MAG: prolipoprotein diacylglyceryl transferase [Planctomycetota bacterium]